jgi:K(+)-stimulated pyrophosphate-energized sodium pump
MLDEDDGARVGVWVALGVVALVVFSLVIGVAWRATQASKAAKAPAAAVSAPTADAADAVLDIPLAGDLIAKVFFAYAKAEVEGDATEALDKTIAAAAAASGKKVVLSGFHDPSGDAVKNAELAKERAKHVREALKAKGLAADRVVLRKPEQTAADGPPEDARRVEIRLADLP